MQGRQVNLAPYAYRLPESLFYVESTASRNKLLDVVGVRVKPSREDVAAWLKRLASDFPGKVLPPVHFATALTLLQMLADDLGSEGGGLSRTAGSSGTAAAAAAAAAAVALDIYAPDSTGVMRRAIELAVNDAPWMSKRVKRSALRLVHEKVPSAVCRAIGAQRLSELVSERLADGFTPSAAAGADSGAVEKIARVWAPNARSREFRHGASILYAPCLVVRILLAI